MLAVDRTQLRLTTSTKSTAPLHIDPCAHGSKAEADRLLPLSFRRREQEGSGGRLQQGAVLSLVITCADIALMLRMLSRRSRQGDNTTLLYTPDHRRYASGSDAQ